MLICRWWVKKIIQLIANMLDWENMINTDVLLGWSIADGIIWKYIYILHSAEVIRSIPLKGMLRPLTIMFSLFPSYWINNFFPPCISCLDIVFHHWPGETDQTTKNRKPWNHESNNLFFLQFDYIIHFVSWWKANILALSLLENDKKETFSTSLFTQCYYETKMGMKRVQSRLSESIEKYNMDPKLFQNIVKEYSTKCKKDLYIKK